MERFVEPKERLPFTQKSAKELALEMNKALEYVTEMTEEELLEDDAEGGYSSDLTSDTISCRENVVNSGSYRLRAVAPFGV